MNIKQFVDLCKNPPASMRQGVFRTSIGMRIAHTIVGRGGDGGDGGDDGDGDECDGGDGDGDNHDDDGGNHCQQKRNTTITKSNNMLPTS